MKKIYSFKLQKKSLAYKLYAAKKAGQKSWVLREKTSNFYQLLCYFVFILLNI